MLLFLDVTFRATQNEISIFIFFYKIPRNETGSLSQNRSPSFQTATNRITIEESRQKNSRSSGTPQCQKCRCTQTRFLGWKDKEVRENVTVNNKNITLNGKNITVKLTQM